MRLPANTTDANPCRVRTLAEIIKTGKYGQLNFRISQVELDAVVQILVQTAQDFIVEDSTKYWALGIGRPS